MHSTRYWVRITCAVGLVCGVLLVTLFTVQWHGVVQAAVVVAIVSLAVATNVLYFTKIR